MKITIRLFAAIPVSLLLVFASATANSDVKNRLETYLTENETFNGTAIVADDSEVLARATKGLAGENITVPLQPNHQFDIGSITKQFTAAAIMRLKDQGKLDFDDKVTDYLPELPWNNITIRQLLTHTSGLPEAMHYYSGQYRQGLVTAAITNDGLVQVLARENLERQFEPGRKWAYNNTGYSLLAVIVERVSGKTYGEFLADEFFIPLEMTSTLVRTPDTEALIKRRAKGFLMREDGTFRPYDQIPFFFLVGGGGIYSTADDLLAWDRALSSGNLFAADTWQEATTSVTLTDGTKHPYGFGWNLKPSKLGQTRVAHGGHWRGFKAAFERLEDSGHTIIILTNNGSDDSVDQMVDDIEAILLQK